MTVLCIGKLCSRGGEHVRDNTWQVVRPMIVMDDVGAKEPGGLPERFGPDPHKYETHF